MTRDHEKRLERLEYRLDRYHEHLESALEHDRQFQMKATWGIVSSMTLLFGMVLIYFTLRWLAVTGFWFGLVMSVSWIPAAVVAAMWSDGGREGDIKKLSRLPKWDELS